MKTRLVVLLLFVSTGLLAKIDLRQFKDSAKLGEQQISIGQAEIIINKMPRIGEGKAKNYIVIALKTDDGKKIRAKYSLESVRFPGCTRRFLAKVTEHRGDGCVVRELPIWAKKGILVVVTLKDASGVVYQLKANATEIEVH
jgi:hypothetical protein